MAILNRKNISDITLKSLCVHYVFILDIEWCQFDIILIYFGISPDVSKANFAHFPILVLFQVRRGRHKCNSFFKKIYKKFIICSQSKQTLPKMPKNQHFLSHAQKVTICNLLITICNQNLINFLTTFPTYAILFSWLYKASLMLTHYCNAKALLPTT